MRCGRGKPGPVWWRLQGSQKPFTLMMLQSLAAIGPEPAGPWVLYPAYWTVLIAREASRPIHKSSSIEMRKELRSAKWFAPDNDTGFQHRAALRAEGFSRESFAGRPVIGICNSWSELNNCNVHLRGVADAVKRGVWAAGGFPLEFMTISLGEELTMPTTMLYRNLMAMDVEEMIRSNPLDGVVLLCGCDKTTPAQLMGAASMDLPSIVLPGGPMLTGR